MGNSGNQGLASKETPVFSNPFELKNNRSWELGRQIFNSSLKRDVIFRFTQGESVSISAASSKRWQDLARFIEMSEECADILGPLCGHFITYNNAIVTAMKDYDIPSLSRLDAIIQHTSVWFTRADILFMSNTIFTAEFQMCLHYFSRSIHAINKFLKYICRPWKVMALNAESRCAFSANDVSKIWEKSGNVVFAFNKLCISARNLCRQQNIELLRADDMQSLFSLITPSRFQLDFFAEASYRGSNNVASTNEIHSYLASWLYGGESTDIADDMARRQSYSFFLIYGSPCSGKTKFAVDVALNLRVQGRLLAAYFINPCIEKDSDSAEQFVKSIAFQCALHCPHLRSEILAAAKSLEKCEGNLSSFKGGSAFNETSCDASTTLNFNRLGFLIGTSCASRAIDIWNKLIVYPWNRLCGQPESSTVKINVVPPLKGILKRREGSKPPLHEAGEGKENKNRKERKSMVIIIDGFSESSSKSISDFLVQIQHSVPLGIRIVVSCSRNSEMMASCRLPKSVVSTLYTSSGEHMEAIRTRGSNNNPIPIFHCLDMDPIATVTALSIAHGECNCPKLSTEMCYACAKLPSRTNPYHKIMDIVISTARPLVDVLLAGRSGNSSLLFTSLAVDELVRQMHDQRNVAYEALCPIIPLNINDLYHRQLETIFNANRDLFRHVGKIVIMLICHSQRLLSVAEVSWTLQVDVAVVLSIAAALTKLFPLVHCLLPSDNYLAHSDIKTDVVYAEYSSKGRSNFSQQRTNRKIAEYSNQSYLEESFFSINQHNTLAADSYLSTEHPGTAETDALKLSLNSVGVASTTGNTPRRETEKKLIDPSHSENLWSGIDNDLAWRTMSAQMKLSEANDWSSSESSDDESLSCVASSVDHIMEKCGSRPVSNRLSEQKKHSESEDDMHQYFYPIHSSLVMWCKSQKYLFPDELFNNFLGVGNMCNNCDDLIVNSAIELQGLSPAPLSQGDDSGDSANKVYVRQKKSSRLILETYGYKYLLHHMNFSTYYCCIVPYLYFSIPWLVGAMKASNVDAVMQEIDKACAQEWRICNDSLKFTGRKGNGSLRSGAFNYGGPTDCSSGICDRKRFFDQMLKESRATNKLYVSLRCLWLCLRRGYVGLSENLLQCREKKGASYELLERELCFIIINWLTPLIWNHLYANDEKLIHQRVKPIAGCNSSGSVSSRDSNESTPSSKLNSFSRLMPDDDVSFLSMLVESANTTDRLKFTHGVPKLLYPVGPRDCLSDSFIVGKGPKSKMSMIGHSNKLVSIRMLLDEAGCCEYMASCSDDCSVRVWNAITGACETIFSAHAGGISCLQEMPCGELASGSLDLTVKIYSAIGKETKHTLLGHEGIINCLAFIKSEQMLASASEDRTVRLWDSLDGSCVLVLMGHKKGVRSLLSIDPAHSNNSHDSSGGTIGNHSSGNSKGINNHREGSSHGYDGSSILLSGSADKTIRAWAVSTGKCEKVFRGHNDTVVAIVGPFMRISNAPNIRISEGLDDLMSDTLDNNSVSADNFRFCSMQDDGSARIWDYALEACLFALDGAHSRPVTCLCKLGLNKIATGSIDCNIVIWGVADGKRELTLRGHTKRISSLSFIDLQQSTQSIYQVDGLHRLLCSGSNDKSVIVWNICTGDVAYRFDDLVHPVTCVLMSNCFGNILLSCGCWDGSIFRWTLDECPCSVTSDVAKEHEFDTAVHSSLVAPQHHNNRITGMCPISFPTARRYSKMPSNKSKGPYFATCSLDGNIKIWHVRDECSSLPVSETKRISASKGGVSCVSVLKCDRIASICFLAQLGDCRLAVVGLESTIVIYPFPKHAVSSECSDPSQCTLYSHFGSGAVVIKGLIARVTVLSTVNYAVNDSNQEWLVTGSDDFIIRMYNEDTGVCDRTLDGHNGGLTCMQSLSEGFLLSGSDDGQVLLWNLNVQGSVSVSPTRMKHKRFISCILKSKHSVKAMYLFKPSVSLAASPIAPNNVKLNEDIQLCVITEDGTIHMRKVDQETIAAIDADRRDLSRQMASKHKKSKMHSTKEVLAEREELTAGEKLTGRYPVIHQLLSRGNLYGLLDAYSAKCAVAHFVSDAITVGYALPGNIVTIGTIHGELFSFKVFADREVDDVAITSYSPMAP